MSNIHGKHVHSVKTWRNLIWGIVFSANTASVTDGFEIIALKCLQYLTWSYLTAWAHFKIEMWKWMGSNFPQGLDWDDSLFDKAEILFPLSDQKRQLLCLRQTDKPSILYLAFLVYWDNFSLLIFFPRLKIFLTQPFRGSLLLPKQMNFRKFTNGFDPSPPLIFGKSYCRGTGQRLRVLVQFYNFNV